MVTNSLLNNKYEAIAEKIIAVLVLYNTKLKDSSTFTTLSKSKESINVSYPIDLVIYDNSVEPMLEPAQSGLYKNWNIKYVYDASNPGVSTAYNVGAEIGKSLKKDWIFILDQDTNFCLDAFSKYFDALHNHNGALVFAPTLLDNKNNVYLSPCGYMFKRGYALKNCPKPGIQTLKNRSLLSSGLLVSLALFEKVNGYNEKLKLDFSDFYFVEKIRQSISVYFHVSTTCDHGLSRSQENSLEDSIRRFQVCCDSAHHFANSYIEYILVIFYLTLRASKLSFKYFSVKFLVAVSSSFVLNKSFASKNKPMQM